MCHVPLGMIDTFLSILSMPLCDSVFGHGV
jgi:hypothetical protein